MKSAKVLLSALLCLGLAACGSDSSSTEPKGPTGEYSGTAVGFGGDVKVTLTLDNGTIKEAVIEGKDETPDVGQAAFEQLSGQLKEANSAEIDGVSGATFTSNAVKEAAAAALESAK
ncbi:MAG: FMN-binding protein [Solobacterium sp.]|nr:FMN-binding protein [Solobacterium sp.]MDO4193182.1 FMN-binding protein [Erysipelotrichaceae bacterium]